MNNHEIVMSYIHRFCTGNIEALEPLLTPDLTFKGPLYSFSSSESYINSLRSDPPENAEYRIQSTTTDHNSVAVFYEYIKKGRTIQIAQLFKICDQKIKDILLVFDSHSITDVQS